MSDTSFTVTGALGPAPLTITVTGLPPGIAWQVTGKVTPSGGAAIPLPETTSDTAGNVAFAPIDTAIPPGMQVEVALQWSGAGSGAAVVTI